MAYRWSDFIRLAFLALTYALLAKVSLAYFSHFNGNVSVAWPPSGLALAALLIGGKKYWPGVLVGAMLGNILAGNRLELSLMIAIGNVLEALLGYFLLSSSRRFDVSFHRPRHYLLLILASVVSSCAGAFIGVLVLKLNGVIPQVDMPLAFLNWWQGDALGIISLVPMLLVWRRLPNQWFLRRRFVEMCLCLGLMTGLGLVIFLEWFQSTLSVLARGYWMFLFVAWGSIRFGRHGVTLLVTVIALQALLGIATGRGFFANDLEQTHLLNFWMYITALTVVGLSLALAIEERQSALDESERTKREIAKAEESSRLILQSVGEGIYGLDLQGKATFVNPACCEMLGYSSEELIGASMHELIHHSYPDGSPYPRDRCPMYAAFKEGVNQRVLDEVLWRKDGSSFPVEYTSNPIFRDGQLIGAVVIFNDVTERKNAEKKILDAQNFAISTLDSVAAHICVIDDSGKIIAVNDAWRHFSDCNNGRRPDYFIGANYLEICDTAVGGEDVGSAFTVAQGIRAVISGTIDEFTHEYPCHSPQKQRWFSIRATRFKQNDKNFVIAHFDITPLKLAEQRLRDAEKQLNDMTAAVPGVVYQFVVNPSGEWTFKYLSRGIETLYEVPRDLALSDHNALTQCILAEDRPGHRASVEESFRTMSQWIHEHRIVTPNGKLKWIRGQATPQLQDDGSVLWNGILLDITETKSIEAKLKRSEQTYRTLFQTVQQGVVYHDNDGKIISANPAAARILGMSPDQMLGHSLMIPQGRAIHPDGSPFASESYPCMEAKRTGQMISNVVMGIAKPDDGQPIWIRVDAIPIFKSQSNEIDYVYSTFTDITAQLVWEAALKESEERFRTLANAAPALIWVSDPNRECSWFNDTWLEYTGRTLSQECGDGWTEMVHSDDLQRCIGIYNTHFDARKPFRMEYRLRRYDGEYHWFIDVGKPRFNANGQFSGYIGMLIDISERKAMEQALRLSQFSLDHGDDGVFWIDNDANILDANRSACRMLGYSQAELIHLSVADIDPLFPVDKWASHWQELKEKGFLRFESLHKTRDGRCYPVEIVANFFAYEGKEYNCAFVRDITERKLAESALIESKQKLDEAQRIAHLGSWDWQIDNGVVNWSDEAAEIYVPDNKSTPPSFEAFKQSLHPDDRDKVLKAIAATLENDVPYNLEHRVVSIAKGERYVQTQGKVFRDQNGKAIRIVGTVWDITERKRLEIDLERQAHIDFLTGINNRGHFMEQAERELTRANRYGSPLSVLMMDIDFFKRINDSHGHKAGDTALKKLVEVCRHTLRDVDIIGRLGGEEFAVLLPETSKQAAIEAAERLRQAVAESKIPIDGTELPLHITVSIGVTSLSLNDDHIDLLLNRADQALYAAKTTGRNKVCHAFDD